MEPILSENTSYLPKHFVWNQSTLWMKSHVSSLFTCESSHVLDHEIFALISYKMQWKVSYLTTFYFVERLCLANIYTYIYVLQLITSQVLILAPFEV